MEHKWTTEQLWSWWGSNPQLSAHKTNTLTDWATRPCFKVTNWQYNQSKLNGWGPSFIATMWNNCGTHIVLSPLNALAILINLNGLSNYSVNRVLLFCPFALAFLMKGVAHIFCFLFLLFSSILIGGVWIHDFQLIRAQPRCMMKQRNY